MIPFSTKGQQSLNSLTDVGITNIQNNQILKFNSATNVFENSNDTLSISTANENISIGSTYDTSVSTANVVIGVGAGVAMNNSSGKSVLIGTDAGKALVDGQKNVFIGEQSGEACVTGDDNTCIGRKAGESCTGNANTFVGEQAGESLGSGNFNICIGHEACAEMAGIGVQNGSKNIVIGNTAPPIATTNFQCVATDLLSQVELSTIANNSAVFGNKLIENTFLSGGNFKINVDPTSKDVTYVTTSASTKHTFKTNNTVEGLAIEDAKVKFQTEVRFAGNHADVASAGTPSTMTLAFIGNDLGIYVTGVGWKKVTTSSF